MPDLILPLLREMRVEMRDGFDRIGRKFAELDGRFDALERKLDDLQQVIKKRLSAHEPAL